MPEPKAGEEKEEYISRCIKQVMDEGETDNKAAAGKCYGMWKQAHKKSEAVEEIVDKHLLSEQEKNVCYHCDHEWGGRNKKGPEPSSCPRCKSGDVGVKTSAAKPKPPVKPAPKPMKPVVKK